MYKVIKFFTDLQDHDRPYHVGDEFPRKGMTVSENRLAELAGSANKQGVPLIEKVKAAKGLDSALPPAESEAVQQAAPLQEEKKATRKVAKPEADVQPEEKPKPKRSGGRRKKETE